MEDRQQRGEWHTQRRPARGEGLVIILLLGTFLGIGILFWTSRTRAAYEARQERAAEPPAQEVVDFHAALP